MEKDKFYIYNSPMFLEDVDINNALVCNKIFSGEESYKYFISYLQDDYKIKPFHIMLPITNMYLKSYDCQTKSMHFLIESDNLLKKYSTIRDKVSSDIRKKLMVNLSTTKKF